MRINCGCNKALSGLRGLGANGLLLNGTTVAFNPADPYYSKLMQLSPQSLATGGNIDDLLAMQNQNVTGPNGVLPGGSTAVSTAQTCTTPACIAAASQLTQTLAVGGNTVGGANPGAVSTSDIMIGTFDATTFINQYGIWIAAGVAALFLLNRK
jgi:hypothetical protein